VTFFGYPKKYVILSLFKAGKELVADISIIGLSADNHDGRPLLFFHMAALVGDHRDTFI
jgi:hypothetical protein